MAKPHAVKVPPYSVVSEKAVIGSLLRDPGLRHDVAQLLPDGGAFFRPDFGRLYDRLRTTTAPPDVGTKRGPASFEKSLSGNSRSTNSRCLLKEQYPIDLFADPATR